jgi:hypothetical protein
MYPRGEKEGWRKHVPRHFNVEPQYIWKVLQSPADAVRARWVRVSDNRVGRASMVSEMDLELEMRC